MTGSISSGSAAGQEELLAARRQDDGDADGEADDQDVVADRPHPRRAVAEVVGARDPLGVEAQQDEEEGQAERDRQAQRVEEAHRSLG